MKLHLPAITAVAMLASVGCGKQQEPAPPTAPVTPPRAETKSVEAAGLTGYDGDKVRGKVDGLLDQNDARNKKLQDLAQ